MEMGRLDGWLRFNGILMEMGGRCVLKSAMALSCLSVMTSVCPASNGEQVIAMVGCQ